MCSLHLCETLGMRQYATRNSRDGGLEKGRGAIETIPSDNLSHVMTSLRFGVLLLFWGGKSAYVTQASLELVILLPRLQVLGL